MQTETIDSLIKKLMTKQEHRSTFSIKKKFNEWSRLYMKKVKLLFYIKFTKYILNNYNILQIMTQKYLNLNYKIMELLR